MGVGDVMWGVLRVCCDGGETQEGVWDRGKGNTSGDAGEVRRC